MAAAAVKKSNRFQRRKDGGPTAAQFRDQAVNHAKASFSKGKQFTFNSMQVAAVGVLL